AGDAGHAVGKLRCAAAGCGPSHPRAAWAHHCLGDRREGQPDRGNDRGDRSRGPTALPGRSAAGLSDFARFDL
ncbi:MAG TPA: hypothetical protein VFZ97_07435, partial [Acidimicrobiales bacterium]